MKEDTLCKFLKTDAEAGDKGYRFLDHHENPTFVPYRILYEKALGVAGAFSRLGIRRGDKIALILPTCPEFFYAFFGALFAGAVPVPLYPPVRLGRMDEYHQRTIRMLAISQTRLVCTDGRIKRILGRTLAGADLDLGCITIGEIGSHSHEYNESDPDADALIQFSSGTTVDPKPVLLTHAQIIANVRAILDFCLPYYPKKHYGAYHCGVSWLPLYHDMGLIGAAMLALVQNSDLTLIPPEIFIARPAIWLRAISKYKAIISPAPNFAYGLCVEKINDKELEGVDLSCWLVALNGAEPISVSTLEKFIDRFSSYGLPKKALTPVYGLSEAALAVSFSDLSQPFIAKKFDGNYLIRGKAVESADGKELVAVGKPLHGYEIEIRNQLDEKLPDGIIGKVLVKGPSIMKEYFRNPEATSHTIKNGWLDTGDNGFIYEGNLYLYGREKDIIIIRGRNYAPQVIEMALDGIQGIRKGCVAAAGYIPENEENERLIVFIERDKLFKKIDDEKLADMASKRITESTGLVPKSVVVLEPGTILRTSSGKLKRQETLSQYLNDTLIPPKPVNFFLIATEIAKSRISLSSIHKTK